MLLDWLIPRSLEPNLDGSPDEYLVKWDAYEGGELPIPDLGDQCTKRLPVPARVPTWRDYVRLTLARVIRSAIAIVFVLVLSDWVWLAAFIALYQIIAIAGTALTVVKWSAIASQPEFDTLYQE
jgi:hypothetical protein